MYTPILDITIFRIFCDNKTAILLTDTQQYPRYHSVQLQIQQILIKLHQIQHIYPLISIELIKIKSHARVFITDPNNIHFKGNAIVDTLANTTAKKITWKRSKMRNISYRTTMTQIHKFNRNCWDKIWADKPQSWTNSFLKTHIKKINKKFYNISKYMNTHQLAIISRLLTKHIELNRFLCIYKMKDTDDEEIESPHCTKCNEHKVESVHHYLLNCKAYHDFRQILIMEIRQIWNGYDKPSNLNLKCILLPFLIIDNQMTDKYNKCPLSTSQQASIWKHICKYVKRTQRLKDLFRVNMEKIT